MANLYHCIMIKHPLSLFSLLWVTLPVYSQANRPLIEQPEYGEQDALIVEHQGYTLSYNLATHCPNWVAWELTEKEVYSTEARRTNDFRGDPAVPSQHRVEGYDYKDSGYDRGHMCPAGDMKWDNDAMSDCFYMTNICPQNSVLNQQWWEHLERACRRWASQEGCIYVCCGPIFDGQMPPRHIGKEVQIRVPDGFFKVVLSLRKGEEKAVGFIYHNTNDRQPMESVATSIDEVEKVTGLNFFPVLEDLDLETQVESSFNLKHWK